MRNYMNNIQNQGWVQVFSRVWAQVDDQVYNQIMNKVRTKIAPKTNVKVWDQISRHFTVEFRRQIKDQLINQKSK